MSTADATEVAERREAALMSDRESAVPTEQNDDCDEIEWADRNELSDVIL